MTSGYHLIRAIIALGIVAVFGQPCFAWAQAASTVRQAHGSGQTALIGPPFTEGLPAMPRPGVRGIARGECIIRG